MTTIAIVGGGAIGLGLAYHLAARGAGAKVTLYERAALTSGTSWHAAGIVGPLRATANMTRLASYALTLFPRLEAETGLAIGYRRSGGYWLARRPERLDELARIAALGRHMGLDARMVAPGEIDLPGFDFEHHLGALWVAEDAHVNPVDLCMAYARRATAGGVVIRERCPVAAIETENGQVRGLRLVDGSGQGADLVALCAGAWSRRLAAEAGLSLPLQPVEHMYVVTEPVADLPRPLPILRDLDHGLYVKGDAGRLVIGGFEPDAKCWDPEGPEADRPFLELAEDWDQFAPFMEAALALYPPLADLGIQRFMNGPESFTADTRPLIGAAPGVEGLFVAAGMNSVGVMSSAGIGRTLAGWMLDGAPDDDVWEVDIARVDPLTARPTHLAARMAEAVADQFAMHWPYKQPMAGRGLRESMLHEHWAREGAVFGLTGGWERGLWYAETSAERDLPVAVGEQPWWPIAEREAARLRDGVVLVDLTPFSKFEVTGPGAATCLQHIAPADIDRGPGRVVYTPLLNTRGGIEADVTVAQSAKGRFLVTSGAATRWRDLAYLRRQARGLDVRVVDLTEDFAVIGVMGGGAPALLSAVTGGGLDGLGYGGLRQSKIAGTGLCAMRLSFLGEAGAELLVPAAEAGRVFDRLIAAGARPLGHYALEGCRLEKGFCHWGHDLGPGITPLEAGLGFAIDWDKDFLGRRALEMQRRNGPGRRLVLMVVEGRPLLLHDEPVWHGGRAIGLTTSGGVGPRTGLSLAFALIETTEAETLATLAERDFEIEVAGHRHPARVLTRPPFDPDGRRMRS